MTGIAEQLRNKDAVITYSTTSDITKDKRPILVDIVAFKARRHCEVGDSPPVREPSRPQPFREEKSGTSPLPRQSNRNRKAKKWCFKNPEKRPHLT